MSDMKVSGEDNLDWEEITNIGVRSERGTGNMILQILHLDWEAEDGQTNVPHVSTGGGAFMKGGGT